jgi:hypothetical protein
MAMESCNRIHSRSGSISHYFGSRHHLHSLVCTQMIPQTLEDRILDEPGSQVDALQLPQTQCKHFILFFGGTCVVNLNISFEAYGSGGIQYRWIREHRRCGRTAGPSFLASTHGKPPQYLGNTLNHEHESWTVTITLLSSNEMEKPQPFTVSGIISVHTDPHPLEQHF